MDRCVRKDTHHDCLFGLYELCGGSRGGEVARDLSLFVRRKGLSRHFGASGFGSRGLAQFHNLMLFPEEVESLTARLKNWRPAEGSSCGGDSREDGAVPPNFTEEELDEAITKPVYAMLGVGTRDGRPAELEVESDAGSNDDVAEEFQDATLVDIMRERIQELERENVALRWRERTAEGRVEAEIQKAASLAAELAAENSHAELEKRLEAMAHRLDIERQRRQTAERDAQLAQGVGEEAVQRRKDELEAAVASAVERERERSTQTLRRAAEASLDRMSAYTPSSKEQDATCASLRAELVETQRELVRAREDAAEMATKNVGAAMVADAMRAASDVASNESVRELLADVDELGAAMRAYTAAHASFATPTSRKVDGDEEIGLAKELLLDVPSLKTALGGDGKLADVLATFARIRTCVPGESLVDHHPEEDTSSRKDGDETEAHTGVDMYIVAEGAVTISPRVATNNPFGIQSHAYVAHPGDVIGEVACVVDALAGIRTRASLPNGPGIDLPARTPVRIECGPDGPARLFAMNSRDVERVLMFGGDAFAETSGDRSILRALHKSVTTRLAELEASANMSTEVVTNGNGIESDEGSRAKRVADLNAPTTARSDRYPLGVRWSETQLRAAGMRRTAGVLARISQPSDVDELVEARETVGQVSKSLRAAAARLRERRLHPAAAS